MKKTLKIGLVTTLIAVLSLTIVSADPPEADYELSTPLSRQSSTIFIFRVAEYGYTSENVAAIDFVYFTWVDSSGYTHECTVDVTYWYLRDGYIHLHIQANEKPNPEKDSSGSTAIAYGTFDDGYTFWITGPGLAWGRGR